MRHCRLPVARSLLATLLIIGLFTAPFAEVAAQPADNNWPRLPTDTEIATAQGAFRPARAQATAENFRARKLHNPAKSTLAGYHLALTFDLSYRGQDPRTGAFRQLVDACLAWLTYETDHFRFALGYCGDRAERDRALAGLAEGWPRLEAAVIGYPDREPVGQIYSIEGDGPVEVAVLSPEPTADGSDLATAKWTPFRWDGRRPLNFTERTVIRTGPNAEVLFRFSTGALVRLKSNTTFVIQHIRIEKTPVSVMLVRLVNGIMTFYAEEYQKSNRQFEVETDRANTSIKGTQLTIAIRDDGATVVSVENGEVEVTDKATGAAYPVKGGQTLTADGQQVTLTPTIAALPAPFQSGVPASAAPPPAPVQSVTMFENANSGAVQNGPTAPTTFTLPTPTTITRIKTYHWNNGRGVAAPGEISLRDAAGQTYGPWPATGQPGQGGALNAYWEVRPETSLPAGDYTVLDSDPATWSCNVGTGGAGIAWVEGYPTP